MALKKAKTALISVFHKEKIIPIVEKLHNLGIEIYSTGGTEKCIKEKNIPVIPIEKITEYPSILGGRVKTLHPKIFGGILNRRENENDKNQITHYQIPEIDFVIVDLYPFEEMVASGSEKEIIEKIDIGGIALIRAAAKNFKDVLCVSSREQYQDFLKILTEQKGATTLEQRHLFAAKAFAMSSHYDTRIFRYFNKEHLPFFRESFLNFKKLRYGENPHQKAYFYGNLEEVFEHLHGKELSFNNVLDADAAVCLMEEFKNEPPTFAILKHNNACGLAQRKNITAAYKAALEADPISAFGGVLIANTKIDKSCAEEINQLFCEVVIAPDFEKEALEILKSKKNRILLKQKAISLPNHFYKKTLNGVLWQNRDTKTDTKRVVKNVTKRVVKNSEIEDLLFASKICKHTKSNAIVLVKNKQLFASGTGQTSRVDALKQALKKAESLGFDLKDAVMASDAFFPFPDCVEIANTKGIKIVIQPGGAIKDDLSINYCNENNMGMVFTGTRHFKH